MNASSSPTYGKYNFKLRTSVLANSKLRSVGAGSGWHETRPLRHSLLVFCCFSRSRVSLEVKMRK